MKNYRLILFLPIILATTIQAQQRPTIFPDAVQTWEDNQNYYLTKAAYEKVMSYYEKEKGAPKHVSGDKKSGRSAWFLYVERLPDDGGLSVNENRGMAKGAARVFSQLESQVVQGNATKERVNGIVQEYEYLKRCYFVMEKDEAGKDKPADEIIFNKYSKKLSAGGTEAINMAEVMQRAQELMAAGKMEEGLALIKKSSEESISAMNLASSPEVVDLWIECLEEIVAIAYPVEISISM
ncbi:MAG: hypothetical protein WD578_13250 [Bacteroidales bacterium]